MNDFKEYGFNTSVERVFKAEGGYVNNPEDKGGETNYGITVAVARAYGYTGSMKTLPKETAKAIYKKNFWDKLRCDDISEIHPLLSDHLFDFGVNAGTGRAVKHLQRALNLLNTRQVDYADIDMDGAMGNGTLRSLKSFANKRGQEGLNNLVVTLVSLQLAFYMDLSEKNQSQEVFTNGWVNRAARKLRSYVIAIDGHA